ncbi:MAG: OmpA family protein [Granulosicoccaceae bacterium]
MGRIILALGGLIALVCVAMYAVFLRAPMIEKDLETRTRQLLTAAGIDQQVKVQADGRQLQLSGDLEFKDKSVAIATEVFGVVDVTWLSEEQFRQQTKDNTRAPDLQVAEQFDGAFWKTQLVVSDGKLAIRGDRPSLDGVSNAIVARLSADYGGQNVSMESDSSRELPVYWADTVNAAAKALRKMESGSAELMNNKLSVVGVVGSEADQEAIKQMLVELTPTDVVWRTEFDVTGAVSAIALVSPAECDAEVAEYMQGKKVQFKKSKTSLQNNAFAVIDGVAEILAGCPSAKVQIGGYTDSRGDAELNLRLSRERAETVKDYLVEKGINMARLDARGYGPLRPISSNKTAKGRAENRRIEFRVIGE